MNTYAPGVAFTEEPWHGWIEEAHNLVRDWEEQHPGRMLSVVDAARLAEHIARAMDQAYQDGEAKAETN